MWPNTLAGSSSLLDTIFVLIAKYGIVVPLACTLVGVVINKQRRTFLAHAGLTFALAVLVDDVLSMIFFRARPFTTGTIALLLENPPVDSSFPSGHAIRAFAFSQPLLIHQKWLGIIATLAAVIVATSRVFVGVHYWTDVLAGAAISIGCAYLVHFGLRCVKKKEQRTKQ